MTPNTHLYVNTYRHIFGRIEYHNRCYVIILRHRMTSFDPKQEAVLAGSGFPRKASFPEVLVCFIKNHPHVLLQISGIICGSNLN